MVLLKPIAPLVDYAVNYEYIVEVLCINKEVPETQCDGKCYLRSQLAEAEEESTPNAPTPPTNEFETEYWMSETNSNSVLSVLNLPGWGQQAFKTLAGYSALPLAPPWS